MFRLNDFFCGCGGMGLGFKQAGFTTVGAWDFDKYAVQSYKENVDSIVEQADITKMTWEDIPQAEVWSFGFPCQDLSLAGKMAGLFEGKRSGLFFEVMRLLDEVRENQPEKLPVFLLAENVKGLKPYLGVLEAEYEKRGYTMQVNMFNSKYWGVPQNRERYFVVGTRKDLDVSFSYPLEQHDYVPKLSSILEPKVAENYYLSEEKANKIIEQALKKLDSLGHVHATSTPDRSVKHQNGRRAKDDEEPMFTLTCQDLHGVIVDDMYSNREPRIYAEASPTLRSERSGLKTIEGEISVVGNVGNTGHHGEDVYDVEGVSPTVKARDYKGPIKILEIDTDKPHRIAGLFDDEKGKHQAGSLWSKNGISPTLDTAQGGWRQPMVLEENNGIIMYETVLPVRVRKFEVDIEKLKIVLRANKTLSNKQIAEKLNKPLSLVEHWFRNDEFFVIPDANIWFELKSLLGIETTEFDESVTTFIEKEGVYDQANRLYDTNGVSPTLTTCQAPTILEEPTTSPHYRVRKLTPVEYGRLQGFPMDTWNQVVSNTQAYKQFGNAVTVNVATAIATQIKLSLVHLRRAE